MEFHSNKPIGLCLPGNITEEITNVKKTCTLYETNHFRLISCFAVQTSSHSQSQFCVHPLCFSAVRNLKYFLRALFQGRRASPFLSYNCDMKTGKPQYYSNRMLGLLSVPVHYST